MGSDVKKCITYPVEVEAVTEHELPVRKRPGLERLEGAYKRKGKRRSEEDGRC